MDIEGKVLSASAFIVIDNEMMIRYASAYFCNMVQIDKDSITGGSVTSVVSSRSRGDLARAFSGITSLESFWQGTIHLQRRGGFELPTVANINLAGRTDGCMVIMRFMEFLQASDLERWALEEGVLADSIWNHLPGVVVQVDEQGRILRWNDRIEQLSGYSFGELSKMQLFDLLECSMRDQIATKLQEAIVVGECEFEANLVIRNMNFCAFLFKGVRFRCMGKRGIVVIGSDISVRKAMEQALIEKTAFFEAQVESSLSGILVTDRNGNRIIQNERLNEMWKIPTAISTPNNLEPQLFFAASKTTNPVEFLGRVNWLNANPEMLASDEIELLDGRTIDRNTGPVFGKNGKCYGRYWSHYDITSRKESESRIRHVATHDSTTGLPNRNYIIEKITEYIDSSEQVQNNRFGVLFLDIDRFKVFNDGFGHGFGDKVLRAVSCRLTECLRGKGVLARYGGDEFLILLDEGESIEALENFGRSILGVLLNSLRIDGREVFVTASIGASLYPTHGDEVDALIGSANLAMYRAKEQGRGNLQIFTNELRNVFQEKVKIETRLRHALSEDRFSLVYQPKVCLKDGRIVGCEALLRWRDPQLGNVPPSEFIPIAEESGLILQLGDWALRTACLQARHWIEAGHSGFRVAVNVSARQFLHQSMFDWIYETLLEIGLSPLHLEIELTESLLAQDVDRTLIDINRLREIGVMFSIDDFGTGYSSLSYLHKLHLDLMKIDRSFVLNMLSRTEDQNIIRAIISLAQNLGFRSIAEGVEDVEQCRKLLAFGCDEIQGNFFSPPVTPIAFESMMKENRRLNISVD